jgi:hypothetical protein
MSRIPTHHTPLESCTVNDRLEKVMTIAEVTYTPTATPPPEAGDAVALEHHPRYSPSSMERIAACPGSVRMSEGMPPLPAGDDAREGTRLHRAISHNERAGLDYEQMELVDRCNALVMELRGENGRVYREERLSVIGSNFEEITFGTVDVLIVKEDKAVIIDWKFGRNEVEEAANNIQLGCYAVGAAQKWGVSSVECHVFQPRIGHRSNYTFTDLSAVRESIEELIEIAEGSEWRLNPSEKTCQYCRAKIDCPASRKCLNLPAIPADEVLVKCLPNLIPAAKQAKKIADAILDKAKDLIASGVAVDGYCLKPGNEVRSISDIPQGFELVKPDGITYEEYLNLCSIKVAKLEELWISKQVKRIEAEGGKIILKNAKKAFDEMMKSVVIKTQNAPSLAEVKK